MCYISMSNAKSCSARDVGEVLSGHQTRLVRTLVIGIYLPAAMIQREVYVTQSSNVMNALNKSAEQVQIARRCTVSLVGRLMSSGHPALCNVMDSEGSPPPPPHV